MRKMVLILSLLLVNQGYSNVKTHNFTINFGGGYDYFQIESQKKSGITDRVVDDTRAKYNGGGFNVELGYLYYKMSNDKMVYGSDTRVGFAMTFANLSSIGDVYLKDYNTTVQLKGYSGSIGSTFQLGQIFDRFRIMADIVGFSMGGSTLFHNNSVDHSRLGDNFNVGLILPGGFQVVFNTGMMLGLRHKIDFVIPAGKNNLFVNHNGHNSSNIFNYSIYASLGYAIGLK